MHDSNTYEDMNKRSPQISQKLWLSVFGMATIIALAFAAQTYIASLIANVAFQWQDQLLRQVSSWYLWAVFFPIIVTLARKFSFDPGTRLKSLLVHILAGALIAFLHSAIHILFIDWLVHPERNWNAIQKIFDENFLQTSFWRFMIYQVILSVCIALNYYRTAVDTEIQSSRLEDNILQAQIESLRMQLDPDFLLKSLNQLRHLMRRDPDEADNMVARLGDYLRLTLENSGNSEVTLREEVEFLKCYLEIENVRMRNRAVMEIEIDHESLDCVVPNLILQAPVEDAIRRRTDDDPVHLVITAVKTDSSLILTIIDYEMAFPDSESPRLRQLLDRINSLYRNPIEMHHWTSSEKNTMRIEIPLVLERRNTDEVITAELQTDDVSQIPFGAGESSNSVRKWLVIAGIFTFLAAYFAIQSMIRDASSGKTIDWAAQLLAATGWYIWALITPLVLKLSSRFPLQQGLLQKNILIHLGGFVCALFFASVAYAIVRSAASLGEYSFFNILPVNLARTPFAFDIICYLTIVAVESALRYHRRIEVGKIRTSKLNTQLSRARLQALKMQLHPHFLFNALNSLSELMQEDPAVAEEMIQNLQDFLRLTVNSNHVHEIPFEKELEFLNCYLGIERVRFQNRLRINMEIEEQAMKVSVPNLVLQPIVENAIRHGIAPRKTPGQIEIRAKRNNGMLTVSVQDNGPGLSKSQRKINQDRSGLGLSNTRERLIQLYGNAHRFEMINAPEGGLIVTLEIPVKTPPAPGQRPARVTK